MNIKPILVPEYVAEEFSHPLWHPNPAPDAVDRSVERVYRLIAHTLGDSSKWAWEICDWQITGRLYFGGGDFEPYGFERVEDLFFIYGLDDHGRRHTFAIFKSSHMAAEYFVWLVSKGTAEIDWKLFMEMEP